MPEPSVKIIPDVPVAPRAVRPMARAQSLWRTVWRRFYRHRLALCGLLVLVVLTLGTLLGDGLRDALDARIVL